MNTQQGRITKLLTDNKITAYRLSKETGVTQSTLSRFLNDPDGKVEMQPDTIYKIAKYFEVSPRWLLTGDNEENLDTPDKREVNTEAIAKLIPLLPIAAQGGSLNDFVVSVKQSDCEKVVSPVRGADFAIPINGDSMAPEYPNGSQIFIKRINEKAFIEWGKVYVLDTCNGVVIKTLVPSENKEYVKCLSINTDPIYAPFEIAWQDIYGVYKVLLCMSIK